MTFLRTSILHLASLLLSLAMPLQLHAQTDTPPQKAYRPGELLVKFKNDASASAANAQVSRIQRSGRLEHIRLAAGMDVEGMRRWYERQANVEYAEPNYIVRKAATPNDSYFGLQWALLNSGQSINGTSGTVNADINANTAWNRHTGNGSVVVAVLDTGIDYLHPDLAANIWRNLGEIAGDGIDNDGNGKIDDIRGWNFVRNNAYPMDDDEDGGHGSHVAGIIGATGNNANGISGINWNVKLMPLKVLDAEGLGNLADIIAAMDYAIVKGAKIINASYAFECGDSPSASERDAIDRARAFGVLVVLAAGNSGCDNDAKPTYPASHALNNIISVGASDQFDRRAQFARGAFLNAASSYGANSVHLFAPGKAILSTLRLNDYGYQSGTSMSSPHVAGAAALLKSYRPALNMFQVREILLKTASPKVALAGLAVTEGRLDIGAAMDYDLNASTPIQPSHLTASRINENRINLSWLDDSTIESGYLVEYRNHPAAGFSSRTTLAAGSTTWQDNTVRAGEGSYHAYRLRAFNSMGDSPPTASISLTVPPLAPDNLRASNLSTSPRLTWIDRSNQETSYRVERAVGNSNFLQIAELPANSTQYDDPFLTTGTQYFYRVRAHSTSSGFSEYSNTLNLKPQSASDGGGGGGCFIATAAYGSAMHPKVNTLRQLRDRYLLTNALGRVFVDIYYRTSPPLAAVIARHDWLRTGVRTLLWPLVWLVEAIVPDVQADAFFEPQQEQAEKVGKAEKPDKADKLERVAQRQLLIKFKPEVDPAAANALLQAQGATRVEAVSPQLYLGDFANTTSRTQAQTRLTGLAQIEHVEVNRVIHRPTTH